MSETGQCQPLWSPDQSSARQPGMCQRSEVRGGGPGFLDVGVHGLWEPCAVLSQQVCRRREGGVRVALCPATAAGTPSRQPRVASAGPVPSTPQLGHGAPAGSHSHLGFFLQAASKASRQSALSATRALSRISVLGCSLWVGVRAMGRHAARGTGWHQRQGSPAWGCDMPFPPSRGGVGRTDLDPVTSDTSSYRSVPSLPSLTCRPGLSQVHRALAHPGCSVHAAIPSRTFL